MRFINSHEVEVQVGELDTHLKSALRELASGKVHRIRVPLTDWSSLTVNAGEKNAEKARRIFTKPEKVWVCNNGLAVLSEKSTVLAVVGEPKPLCITNTNIESEKTVKTREELRIFRASEDSFIIYRKSVSEPETIEVTDKPLFFEIGGKKKIEFGRETISAILEITDFVKGRVGVVSLSSNRVMVQNSDIELWTEVKDLKGEKEYSSRFSLDLILKYVPKVNPSRGEVLFRREKNVGILVLENDKEKIKLYIAPTVGQL